VPDVMEQSGQTHLLLRVKVEMSWQDFREKSRKVHCSDNMFKPSMVSCWIDEFRSGELAQSPESLHRSSINNRLFSFADSDVSIDRVLDEAPCLRHDRMNMFDRLF